MNNKTRISLISCWLEVAIIPQQLSKTLLNEVQGREKLKTSRRDAFLSSNGTGPAGSRQWEKGWLYSDVGNRNSTL